MTKKTKNTKSEAEIVSRLLDLTEQKHLCEGALWGEINDECQHEAHEKLRKISGGLLIEQLEYLLSCGYTEERLINLIEQYSLETNP